jgi:hypothetical protein
MTKVVHCKKEPDSYYIGRKKLGYHFGNPFSHKEDTYASIIVGSREEACERFKTWLDGETDLNLEQDRRLWILKNIHILKGRRLGCWCKPLACHGDYLAYLADKSDGTCRIREY